MNREYKIGLMLRERYDHFLGESIFNDFYARSTDNDRTKMSLQLVWAGLSPANNRSRWNPKVDWTPIPLHYKVQELDFLENNKCPRYMSLKFN